MSNWLNKRTKSRIKKNNKKILKKDKLFYDMKNNSWKIINIHR